MTHKLFGTNGFRGIIGEELTPELSLNLGYAIGTVFKKSNVIVGSDNRLSNEMISNALISGLLAVGTKIYNAGMLPTPVLQKYIKENAHIDYGVMVTASHNPPEYNGFKVLDTNGVEIPDNIEKDIESIFNSKKFNFINWNQISPIITVKNVISEYIDDIIDHIDLESIKNKKIKVVIDPNHGVTLNVIPQLLKKIGCEVTVIHMNPDGSFPSRPPEPRPDNLHNLSDSVIKNGADFGVAFDGDGDRAIFCDEKGKIWWGDVSGIIIGSYLAKKQNCKLVVTPVTSSLATEITLQKSGVKVIRTKVGSKNVAYEMIRENGIWGFEENGGGIYAPHLNARDGGISTLLLIQIIADYGSPLSHIFETLPKLYQEKIKIHCKLENRTKIINEIKNKYKNHKLDLIDGVKIWLKPETWVLIRPSGTEPIIRIFSEANTLTESQKTVQSFKTEILEILSSL